MADFTGIKAKQASVDKAHRLLDHFRAGYSDLKQAQALIALYQAGTDPVFNAAVNAIYSAGQRAELAAMKTTADTFLTDMETTHGSAIGNS